MPAERTTRPGTRSLTQAIPAQATVRAEPGAAPWVAPQRQRWDWASVAIKRGLDVSLSLILFVGATLILVPACIAIMLDSPGSPLYRQWRSGKDGKPFRILKLRTMVVDADQSGPALTQDADPRITRVGSTLRRSSIDELPQLINVLAGHMSLVGPRPELVSIVETYSPRQMGVLSARPGLTGWAQVNGRDDLSINEKLELDLEYVANLTVRLDLTILARTIGVVAGGQGTKW